MEINLTKKISHEIINAFKTFFYLPTAIAHCFYKNIFYRAEADEYLFRIQNEYSTDSDFYFKLQIINTRAVFEITLSEIILNFNILYKLDPFQIARIGYILKQEEIKKISLIGRPKDNVHKKIFFPAIFSPFLKKIKFFLEKSINKNKIEKSFRYSFVDHLTSDDGKLNITLQIKRTDLEFNVPADELLKDFNLLKNIDVLDLMKIGYILKEEENRRSTAVHV